jgi:Domain of unknown function (DUF2437)
MTNWVRFRHRGKTGFGTLKTGFGTLAQSEIAVHEGEMFGTAKPSGQQLALVAKTINSGGVEGRNNQKATGEKPV